MSFAKVEALAELSNSLWLLGIIPGVERRGILNSIVMPAQAGIQKKRIAEYLSFPSECRWNRPFCYSREGGRSALYGKSRIVS